MFLKRKIFFFIKRKINDVFVVQFDILIQNVDNFLSIKICFVIIQNALFKNEIHFN